MSADDLKPSEKFEQQIRRIHELIEQPESQITWSDRFPDPDNSSQPRQIDVTIRRDGKLTLVECRIHRDRQDVQWVEELIGRRLSLRADAVIAVSASGFTEGAIRKAKSFGIILRDFLTLTEEEISSWGHLARVSLTFYEFTHVGLVFRFDPHHLTGLTVDQIEEDLRGSPSKLYGIFELVADTIDTENPQGSPCRFTGDIGKEGLHVAARPVARIGFSANVARREREITIPSVVAYDAPGTLGTERQAFVQRVDLGDFEITSSSNDVLVTLDLSPVKAPPRCKFHSVNIEFDRNVRMRGLEIVGPLPFRIELQDLLIRLAPFEG
ncbi:MAG: restriction endonuclease [Acidobacteriota bacterium]